MLQKRMVEILEKTAEVHRVRGTEAYLSRDRENNWTLSVWAPNDEIEILPVRLVSPEIQLHLVPVDQDDREVPLEH